MSKIGRKKIALGTVSVTVNGQAVEYKGKKSSGIHVLPAELSAGVEDGHLRIQVVKETERSNCLHGLHRALLANKVHGAEFGFERQLRIVGLGFKAAVRGAALELSLGYTDKINFDLPTGVSAEVDKSGQLLTFRSPDKELLGLVCSKVRAMREPEPYKGTGIQYVNEVILRKAGKAKSA